MGPKTKSRTPSYRRPTTYASLSSIGKRASRLPTPVTSSSSLSRRRTTVTVPSCREPSALDALSALVEEEISDSSGDESDATLLEAKPSADTVSIPQDTVSTRQQEVVKESAPLPVMVDVETQTDEV